VGAHWIADRQSGPTILRFGSEAQRREILPRIARGECYFCIGMSEPGAGSDLAAVRTKAVPTDGGYRIDGAKLWTTNAHNAHYMILLCRTERGDAAERHGGMSQFLIDLSTPGITIRPVRVPTGEHHFNEVVFDDVQVPADALLGAEGDGWKQVMGELAYERSGPERFLSSFTLYKALVAAAGPEPSERMAIAIGRLAARFITLRRMSRSVAGALQAGADPSLQAANVKDLGALLEQEIPEIANDLLGVEPTLIGAADDPAVLLGYTMMHAPSFSLRGGTREILRGIIARGLGLR
jgi:alkylation response protein AidB-like acyl-CoA dehydrogenase